MCGTGELNELSCERGDSETRTAPDSNDAVCGVVHLDCDIARVAG